MENGSSSMRVAIIEVGHWHASMHLRSFHLAGAQIVGVSDGNLETAQVFANGVGCPGFADYRELLEDTRPDFCMVMGRHADMPAIAETLLKAGIPFAIEKPIGTSAEDLVPLVDLARQRGAFVAVPFTGRYSPLWTWLDRLEQSGRLGLRSHAHFRIINGPPSRYELDGVGWMLDPAISGGGCLRNLGIHTVDAFLRFVGGEEIEVVSAAMTTRVYGTAVEEMGAALLHSESGVICTIEAGYSYASMASGDYEARVSTANCTIIDRADSLQIATLDDNRIETLAVPDQGDRYDRFGADTLERLRSGRPPVATIEDCYRAMGVIDEIYKKAIRFSREQA